MQMTNPWVAREELQQAADFGQYLTYQSLLPTLRYQSTIDTFLIPSCLTPLTHQSLPYNQPNKACYPYHRSYARQSSSKSDCTWVIVLALTQSANVETQAIDPSFNCTFSIFTPRHLYSGATLPSLSL